MKIEVNGVEYQQKHTQQVTPKKPSKSLMMLYGMAMMCGGQGVVGSSKQSKPPMPINELVNEYRLIQQKKSHLTRSQRNWVEYQFKEIFEPIKTPK